ncbi:unnamed protein product [Coregonus sp. 'balchen']|nr:unnamed protein product [Coregonus sp. 'balchen']
MGERGVVEADHIPPKSSLKQARDQQSQMKDLQQKNPKLYDMINSIGSDSNGENLPTMRLLADTLVSGDVEKSLKFSFIMAHPIASDQLRAGNTNHLTPGSIIMSPEGTVLYYKAGFNQMLNHHCKEGIIDQNQLERLKSWVADKKYLDQNTPEYNDIRTAIQ